MLGLAVTLQERSHVRSAGGPEVAKRTPGQAILEL